MSAQGGSYPNYSISFQNDISDWLVGYGMVTLRIPCKSLIKSRVGTVLKLECWYMSLPEDAPIPPTCPILVELG